MKSKLMLLGIALLALALSGTSLILKRHCGLLAQEIRLPVAHDLSSLLSLVCP